MIIHLNPDNTRLALTIKHLPSDRRVADWRNLQLVIMRGQTDADHCCEYHCHTGGSPWYLWGCWPGKPTGIDIANPLRYYHPHYRRYHMPPIIIPAHEYDTNGRVSFVFPKEWFEAAMGRYTGEVWYLTRDTTELTVPYVDKLAGIVPKPTALEILQDKYPTPDLYPGDPRCHCCPAKIPPPPPPPPDIPPTPPPCVLVRFDIDYGYRCSSHIVQDAAVEFPIAVCEEEI